METKAKPQAKSKSKKERKGKKGNKSQGGLLTNSSTTRPMLHVDVIAMIPKEVDLLHIIVDEAK
jgi:hypothetical protein